MEPTVWVRRQLLSFLGLNDIGTMFIVLILILERDWRVTAYMLTDISIKWNIGGETMPL
jgi:hypothetical protein